MIPCRTDALLHEHFGQFACGLPAARIDDGRSAGLSENVEQLRLLVHGAAHDIRKVRACKTHLIYVGRAKLELALDVLHHGGSGRGGQCEDGNLGQQLPYLRYLQVGRAEVVAPLADAVGLVHSDEAHPHVAQFGQEEFGAESFGRDVEQLHAPEDGVLQRLDDVGPLHSRVDSCRPDASPAQMVHLVLHQRDQGRDDQAHTLHRQRRHLEGDRLSSPRRHQSQGVLSSPYALDDLALDASEVRVAPVLTQYGAIVCHHSFIPLLPPSRWVLCPLSAVAPPPA